MVPTSLEQARAEGEEELIEEEAGPSSKGAELAIDATMAEPRTEGEAEGLGKRKHAPESSERYKILTAIATC